MKKILILIFLVCFCTIAYSQVLQKPTVYGYQFRRVGGDSLLFVPSDTFAVPTPLNGLSHIARKGTSLYYWNGSAWIAVTGGGASTWQQTLTTGSTLTGNNTITGGGFNWTWNNAGNQTVNLAASKSFIVNGSPSYVDFSIGQSTNVFTDQFIQAQGSTYSAQQQISSYSTGSIVFAYAGNTVGNKSSGYELMSDSVNLYSIYPSAYLSKIVIKDTITLRPHRGNLRTDSLNTVSNTIRRKVVVHDTVTGMFERVDPLTIIGNDTTTLATFGGGARIITDTTLFTDSTLYGSLYLDVDTFVITKIVANISGGTTDTLGIQLYFNDSLNIGTANIATSTLALTSQPQGHSTTTFSTSTIPPGNFIWCKSPTVIAGRKPEYLSVSLIGYRKRRA